MHILKFGGTSIGDEQSWRRVLEIIKGYQRPFIIVSATARTTRQLLQAAHTALDSQPEAIKKADRIRRRHHGLVSNFLEQSEARHPEIDEACHQWINQQCHSLETKLSHINQRQELSPKCKDAIAAIGERLSSDLFARCGQAYGLPTRWIDAGELMRTNSNFGKAEPDTASINKLAAEQLQAFPKKAIAVMGGFYGQDHQGNTTTLGFEGSDYSAGLVGAALSAEAIEIWTDVSGIYTCDPRVVQEARPIPELSFQQATELAYFGAKVLHPSTTKPAFQQNIPIRVKNIFCPQDAGTSILSTASYNGRAKAMTFKKEATILTITSGNTVMGHEFLANIFQALNTLRLPVDVVVTTEASVAIAVEQHQAIAGLIDRLQPLGQVEVTRRQGIISLIGCNAERTQDLVNDVLECLESETINLISFSQSKRNLNVVLNQQLITEAVRKIHRSIFG